MSSFRSTFEPSQCGRRPDRLASLAYAATKHWLVEQRAYETCRPSWLLLNPDGGITNPASELRQPDPLKVVANLFELGISMIFDPQTAYPTPLSQECPGDIERESSPPASKPNVQTAFSRQGEPALSSNRSHAYLGTFSLSFRSGEYRLAGFLQLLDRPFQYLEFFPHLWQSRNGRELQLLGLLRSGGVHHRSARSNVVAYARLRPAIARSPICTWSRTPTCPAITT